MPPTSWSASVVAARPLVVPPPATVKIDWACSDTPSAPATSAATTEKMWRTGKLYASERSANCRPFRRSLCVLCVSVVNAFSRLAVARSKAFTTETQRAQRKAAQRTARDERGREERSAVLFSLCPHRVAFAAEAHPRDSEPAAG